MEFHKDLPSAVQATEPFPLGGAGDAFAYIDLVRLGRTDWWSGVKGLFKIIAWQLLIGVSLVAPFWLWRDAIATYLLTTRLVFTPAIDIVILAGTTAGSWFAVRSATVRSQGRPFLSLISAELRLRPSRVLLGAALWLGSEALLTGSSLLYDAMADPAGLADTRPESILAALLCVALIPLQAAGEELIFRGWLTQTLGQFLRRRWPLVLIVGLLFALAHGFSHGIFAVPPPGGHGTGPLTSVRAA